MKIRKNDLLKLNESLKKWIRLTESRGDSYFEVSMSKDGRADWARDEGDYSGRYETLGEAAEQACRLSKHCTYTTVTEVSNGKEDATYQIKSIKPSKYKKRI